MNDRSARRFQKASGVMASLAVLSGCTHLSGLNGSADYACKAPEGITCQSVSGTYANAATDNLPSQRSRVRAGPTPGAAPSARSVTPAAGAPLRSSPRILRLWFKPWEDADQDLFDQGYVYVQVDGGRWLVEHAQRAIREGHAAVRAVSGPAGGSSPAAVPSSSPAAGPAPSSMPARPAAPAGLLPRNQPRE